MLDILKTILIVGWWVLVIIFFLLLVYSVILYFKIVKVSNSIQVAVWNIKITKMGVEKTFYFLNRLFKKNGLK